MEILLSKDDLKWKEKHQNMRLLLLLSITLLLQSCLSYRTYSKKGVNNLTNLNFVPHNEDIDVFFAGESGPEKDYVRLALIKETRTGYSTSPGQLLKVLEYRSKQAGADALIVMGTTENGQTVERLADDRIVTIPRNHMWGIAIRYADNLEKGLSMLSNLSVETQGEIAMMEGGRIDVDEDGVFIDKDNTKWTKYVQQHSLEYLLDQRRGWSVATRNAREGYRRTRVRRHMRGNQTLAKVEVNYLRSGKVGNMGILMLDGVYTSTTMTLRYNDQRQLVGREWVDNTNVRYVTECTYSDDGRLLREDYQRQKRGEVLAPVLSVKYEYASPTVIEALIEQEQIVKGQ